MKAIIANPKQNARRMDKKETVNHLQVVTVQKGEIIRVCRAEFYMSRSASASVVYCNVWAHGKTPESSFTISGYGSAGGGGYHKESAALADALKSAGVELYGSAYDRPDKKTDRATLKHQVYFGGAGSAAMESALVALARACGYRGKVKVM